MSEKIQNTQRLIVSYETLESQGATLEEKIEVLKALKETSKVEEWSYRLAETYEKAGMIKECLDQCDELLLWYNNGAYTKAALELKEKYGALTPLQQVKYDEFMEKERETMTDRLPNLESYIHRSMRTAEVAKDIPDKSEKTAAAKKKDAYVKPDVVEVTSPEADWEQSVQVMMQEQLPEVLETAMQAQLPDLIEKTLNEQLPDLIEKRLNEQLPLMVKKALKAQIPSILKKEVKGAVTVAQEEVKAEEATVPPQVNEKISEQAENPPEQYKEQACSQGYLLVGPRGTYTSKEAVGAIRALLKNCDIQGKSVKITAAKMTDKKLQTVSRMEDLGVAVIENAAELSSDMAKALNEVLEQGAMTGIVVLADEKEALREFLTKNFELKGKFTLGVRY